MLDEKANLKGKVAALLGGGGGIGGAATLGLAAMGVDVAVLDKDAEAMAETKRQVEAMGRRFLSFHGDVLSSDNVRDFYAQVGEQFDRLDVVVNVAGGVKQRDFLTATDEQDAEDIRRNFGYVIQSIRLAVPLIERADRGGSIINFTTIEAYRGAASFSVYAGAKAANANLRKALAVELGRRRIRINEVTPDTTPSNGNNTALLPELAATFAETPMSAVEKAFAMYIPMGTPASQEDLADTVVFLASDLSRSITGVNIHVDGGTSAAGGFINWPGGGYCPAPLGDSLKLLFPNG
ncbi:SDR family NAD(P)-dependent oxidoreductase [Novosphingobium taihuense]|uniref:NAD(P)-dependent dehydrogenase (Short-subunit alcohol dehydrogenase family) n=1 Tax=Novosphingobium taihuense TaxID=260085 RepID=A0A7W7ADG7_9SPHN|nr:SDR family oxidoreductase [Novosphingobium taihuense]MBB4614294.1 NAD(P)-dependent dehydrogenase (short-subunit alcohol dehydrogenase family) [Novosphingobium taihuense]TWH87141.1 NAD(P)-dependent dehydrogenase (short-subunit alcohol dehydrogenase family) [Novosphingobium taihuense]